MSDTAASQKLPAGAGPNGWLAFAGILLFLNGMFSAMWGLAAITDSKVVTIGGGGDVTIWDFTLWGWAALVIGVLMAATGVGLFLGNTAARMAAVVFTVLHALSQFGSISAFPLWSILVVALDVVILYQLVARWQLEE
ncbi:MAG: hypothetical protein V9E83_05530 [Baekduia sp.]